jgi:hypothetical protein
VIVNFLIRPFWKTNQNMTLTSSFREGKRKKKKEERENIDIGFR